MEILMLSFFTQLAKDKPLWVEFISMLIPAGLAVWGFVRAFRAWERQKKREIELQFEQKRYERKLEACLGLWPLLAYMSSYENDKAIFVERGDKEYFFRPEQADEYIRKLAEVFFDQGHGVFAPLEVREGLYHFRNLVYGVKLATAREGAYGNEIEIKVKKKEMVEVRVREIFQKVNASLRNMLLNAQIDFRE